MDPLEPEPRPPAPPKSIPPLPPTPEMLRPSVPHIPLTPMMDFFQRRLESLEKELVIERERARSAQGLLQQQEAMRGEVESQLKSLTENLKREKTEREGEESKSHARGRIDSLEKRLDEMHQSWVSLLKDTVTQRETGAEALAAAMAKEQGASAAGMRQELVALAGTMRDLLEKIGQWRAESSGISQVLPEIRGLANQIPVEERRFEGQVNQILAQFSSELRERMAGWERRQEIELEKQEERLQNFGREKAAMLRAWEEQNHGIRQEQLKEKIQREAEANAQLAEIARRLDDMRLAQEKTNRESSEVKAQLARAVEMLMTPPKAKDQVIAGLELEKEDLHKALIQRGESLHRYALERREIEKTMGDSIAALNQELDEERQRYGHLSSRIAALELESATLRDKLESAARISVEKDARCAALSDERDQLARVLIAEAERVRAHIEEKAAADEAWNGKMIELQKRISEEIELRAKESTLTSELRAQIATLTDHMTRALQEKDSVVHQFSSWASERERLLGTLKEKDEMISMLNATFQNMLKKG